MLSTEILNRLSQNKKNWFESFWTLDVKPLQLIGNVLELYHKIDSTLQPKVFISEGPLNALQLLSHCLGKKQDSKFEMNVGFGEYSATISLQDKFNILGISTAKSCNQYLKNQWKAEQRDKMLNMIFWDINMQIVKPIASIADRFVETLSRSLPIQNVSCHSPSWVDADWTGFFDILCASGLSANHGHNAFSEFIQNGGFKIFAFANFAVVLPKPCNVEMNRRNLLHSERQAALAWPDGTGLYFWEGVQIPEKLVLHKELLTRKDIIDESNAEVRRCYQEILGSERFSELLGLVMIDHKKDRLGNDLKLFKTEEKDKVAGDFIHFARVICPSTSRAYFLCVPPSIYSVDEAVAWTFGRRAAEYNLTFET